ncbi:PilX N-terminal domain-containing pilus assembly protein [Glaciecola petra]|uniref:PilX N-terminal domain-containing pilus assembly protein n=1 Tax=Glaciecola petra TaxID=3075602 RepID=A0ABU2ZT65_9ALTE|nr:PilX N-terminal domain-containing pilus assembly protein [Aestuariibacter sp. P117]MDT0595828.1 PilX N-terminal domain-containing pilus assembly protein [Aestuariibacter sp. P117]
MKNEKGLVLVFALLVLLSITVLGVSAVSSSLLQGKMASSIERKSVAFDAAEAAIAGVVFESEDESVLVDPSLLDPLSEARQLTELDLDNDTLTCFDNNRAERVITQNGLPFGQRHTASAKYSTHPPTNSWSRTAFIREQACRGSSNVIGGSNINCHVFIVKGCGQTEGSNYVVANSLTAAVFAPASN